ncbi:hypothetical protein SMETH9_11830 [Serratia marcescens]|nr:hypothetical protein SMETH9_11830 [Serratia marcescens]
MFLYWPIFWCKKNQNTKGDQSKNDLTDSFLWN